MISGSVDWFFSSAVDSWVILDVILAIVNLPFPFEKPHLRNSTVVHRTILMISLGVIMRLLNVSRKRSTVACGESNGYKKAT